MAEYEGNLLCDSFNIFSTSLKNIGEQIGLAKLDIDIDLISGKVQEVTTEMISYCKRDCEIVFLALKKLVSLTGCIRPTLASFSMEYFRNSYLHTSLEYSPLVYDFFSSYFGGRTEAFKIGTTNAECIDINSMYPHAMVTARFPNPRTLNKCKKSELNKTYIDYLIKNYEGMLECTVIHKKTTFGYLPLKHKINKSDKLIFPYGTFRGFWNFNELRFAIEQGAVEIIRYHSCTYSKNFIAGVFNNFINETYTKRHDNTGFMSYLFKILMNSLYGKTATKINTESLYFEEIPIEFLNELNKKGTIFEIQTFNKERQDCFIIVHKEKNEYPAYSIPLFASYITSFARVHLLQNMIRYEKQAIVYCDTDSIFYEQSMKVKDSNVLGKFKKENKIVTKINGLKDYEFITDNKKQIKLKGVNKKSIKINKNTYQSVAMVHTKEALRRNKEAGEFIKKIKCIKNVYDKRIVKENGWTEPLKIDIFAKT